MLGGRAEVCSCVVYISVMRGSSGLVIIFSNNTSSFVFAVPLHYVTSLSCMDYRSQSTYSSACSAVCSTIYINAVLVMLSSDLATTTMSGWLTTKFKHVSA